jgi:hypothetical protein
LSCRSAGARAAQRVSRGRVERARRSGSARVESPAPAA